MTEYLSKATFISRSISFPELMVPLKVILKAFSQRVENNRLRKLVQYWTDNVLEKQVTFIIAKRSQMKEKALRGP